MSQIDAIPSATRSRRSIRFGLKTTLLVVTALAFGLGLYAARQKQLAHSKRRFDELLERLQTLFVTPPAGFEQQGEHHTFTAVSALGSTRMGYATWMFALTIPASKANLSTDELFRAFLGHYQLGLPLLGMRSQGAPPMRKPAEARDIFSDDRGEFTLVMDYEIDLASMQVEIRALWLVNQRNAWSQVGQ